MTFLLSRTYSSSISFINLEIKFSFKKVKKALILNPSSTQTVLKKRPLKQGVERSNKIKHFIHKHDRIVAVNSFITLRVSLFFGKSPFLSTTRKSDLPFWKKINANNYVPYIERNIFFKINYKVLFEISKDFKYLQ